MLVKNVMLTRDKLITVAPTATIKQALEVIDKNNLLSIPVVEGDKF